MMNVTYAERWKICLRYLYKGELDMNINYDFDDDDDDKSVDDHYALIERCEEDIPTSAELVEHLDYYMDEDDIPEDYNDAVYLINSVLKKMAEENECDCRYTINGGTFMLALTENEEGDILFSDFMRKNRNAERVEKINKLYTD